jgi:hypothetical protein
MKMTVRGLAVIASLVLGLGLTGCGSDDKSVTTPDGSKVTVDGDGDSVTIKSDDGETTIGKGLPDGFPSEDVPVIDAKIIGGAKGAAGGPYTWSVILQADGDATEVFDEISSKLTTAGFTAGRGIGTDKVHTGQFTGPKYDVSVNAAEGDSGVNVTYLVRDAE